MLVQLAMGTVMVLVQALGQVAAAHVLRRQPGLRRPYRMWPPPPPSIVALLGRPVIHGYAGTPPHGRRPWGGARVVASLIRARHERERPCGPKRIREEYLRSTNPGPGRLRR
ncbi:hypothetical protein [Streptomyces kronopolitis]|uniref:hypothetical protein n=1 Tax=Streptomyces kronopolitis TaxID=1612435 RepID=UPI00342B766B